MVFTEVQPVRAAPPTTGLVASAPVVNDGTRWEQGFAWRPERCFSVQGFGPCGTPDSVPEDVDPGVQYYQPPGFRVRDWCTTLNGRLDVERVRRQVEAATSFVVAQELWDGALSTADPGTVNGAPYVNPFLADGTATVVPPPADLTTAIAVLEQEAMAAANGQTVWLHMPISMLPPVSDLRRVGNVIYTASDNVIVADAGYPTTGTIYATGPVQVRLSPVVTTDDPAETTFREINRQEVWAERVFAATFDPCVHMSMNVTPAP